MNIFEEMLHVKSKVLLLLTGITGYIVPKGDTNSCRAVTVLFYLYSPILILTLYVSTFIGDVITPIL